MKVSPSELEIFGNCPQQFIWTLDPNKTRVKRNLMSSLGNIAHKVLATAHKGGFEKLNEGNRISHFNETWNAIEKEEFESIQSDWPNAVVPQPIRWPKYFAIKMSTQYLVEKALQLGEVWKKVGEPSQSIIYSHESYPWVEKFIESEKLKLKGIPDLVMETSTGLEIVDYKTGKVTDPEKFSKQMHIYLMLVGEISNRNVTRLVIRDFSLQEKEIPIDQSMISKINNEIISAEECLVNQIAPTRASLENCRYCNFKNICNDFQNLGLQDTPEPIFLEGEILQIHKNTDLSKVSLQLQIQKSIPGKFKGSVWISGLSIKLDLTVGETIQIFENLHLTDSLNLQGSWNTNVSKKVSN